MMYKRIGSILALIVLLISTLLFAFNVQIVRSSPTTWTVDDDGPADFSSIQAAINSASDGDTIYVHNGIYFEHVVVDKTVLLLGESRSNTIVDGNGLGTIFSINSNNVLLRGFTIRNAGFDWYHKDSCIKTSSSNIIVIENDIIGGYVGVIFENGTRNIISNNRILAARDKGIWLWNSSGNILSRNILSVDFLGIGLGFSDGNTIWGNNITNSIIGWGIYIGASEKNNLTYNFISSGDIGVFLEQSEEHRIMYNNLSNFNFGLFFYSDSNFENRIYHNNFMDAPVHVMSPGNNTWDDGYPSGGNFWSDYTGVDNNSGYYQNETGSDGIGDTAYVIDAVNQDRYPLMQPWTPQNAIEKLITDVENMNLQQGIDNSLDAKLNAVLDAFEALNADQRNDAINKLNAFINEVEAQRGKKLTTEQADYLIAAAKEIIGSIKG